jgi:pyruvate ferredoxin oxidoreductase gamma subunit/2-oxoisovalerate ferredoxin oxidoreductase gamma subunit
MIEIRIHGRGGQGAVVASKMLVTAAAREGRKVQAFPVFGAERRGAPVAAFARLDDRKIRIRCEVYEPDCVIVLDPVLYKTVNVTAGLKENGLILLNSSAPPDSYSFPGRFRVATVDAGGIAIKHRLGSRTEPIVNTAILGAFAKASGLIGMEALAETIREAIPGKSRENEAAAREAYASVKTIEGAGGKEQGA